MGIVLHDFSIFERAGFALVGIAYKVYGPVIVFGKKAPFQTCREAGASPSPKLCFLDFIQDILLVQQGPEYVMGRPWEVFCPL